MYKVDSLGSKFVVIYQHTDGEKMRMINKYYETEKGATNALNKLLKTVGKTLQVVR